ncbi:chloramphenicol acetyltransferase [Bacillus hominis]|uniref:Chloramphenicol acetyltransferase n=1 Tax=Bacillus hominis TaxID=2817478 RepID=A0ABT7R7B7_9BACI|nr:chloramphenicol acetyltransferase [Bacillus hominis]MDM5438812.1 chloramphenicol acetyltransferase [Bacillus hominis]
MKEGENMGIIAFEGASAVGKSTTCRELERNYGAFIIPEVNVLFERPRNEHRTWYFEKQVERWNMAVQKSQQYEIVILDGDIYQPLSYNWCFHFDIFNQPLSLIENFYKEKLINREIGFPDQYFYLYTGDEELRKRKEFDQTKKRRNFEKHLHISKAFQRYYENLNTVADGYCKLIEAKSIRNNELEIMKSVKGLNVREESRFDVSRLDGITNWLQEHRA